MQGEMCGPSIQDNKYKFDSLHYFLFGIFDSDRKTYFGPQLLLDTFKQLRDAGATIEIVPQLVVPSDHKTIKDIGLTVDEWLSYVETKSTFNPESWNEGVVIRSLDNRPYGVRGMEGGRFSFKVINNKFLLQYNL
jgi:RNA ligase.